MGSSVSVFAMSLHIAVVHAGAKVSWETLEDRSP